MGVIALRDAVADLLKVGDFPRVFDPVKAVMPELRAEKLKTLTVTVLAGPTRKETYTREAGMRNTTIYVVVQKALGQLDRAGSEQEAESLVGLVESVEDYLDEVDFDVEGTDYKFISFDETVERAPMNIEQLRESGVFATVITLLYEH